jgi:hypothetical protein
VSPALVPSTYLAQAPKATGAPNINVQVSDPNTFAPAADPGIQTPTYRENTASPVQRDLPGTTTFPFATESQFSMAPSVVSPLLPVPVTVKTRNPVVNAPTGKPNMSIPTAQEKTVSPTSGPIAALPDDSSGPPPISVLQVTGRLFVRSLPVRPLGIKREALERDFERACLAFFQRHSRENEVIEECIVEKGAMISQR